MERVLSAAEAREDPAARLGWFVILGTVPISILGVLLEDQIETAFRDLRVIALALLLFSFVLGFADAIARNRLPLERLTARHAVVFGLAQSLALIPGVSRSGGTISAGLLLGYTREAATRYSFLLAIPAVLASGLFELRKIRSAGEVDWGPTARSAMFVAGRLRRDPLADPLRGDTRSVRSWWSGSSSPSWCSGCCGRGSSTDVTVRWRA